MQQQDPRSDRSRGAVYQAEDTIAAVMAREHRIVRIGGRTLRLPPEIHFGTIEAVQAFVDETLASPSTAGQYPQAGPVRVRAKRGFRSATYSEGTIHVPAVNPRGRWAMTRGVVLHEIAHHLAARPGHGAPFRAALVHLYRAHLGPSAADLLTELFRSIDALPEPRERADDSGQTRRVAALLAKAQATTSADEAEAYLAKAALVAQRHSVDLAVAAMSRSGDTERPSHRMLTIGRPRQALNKLLVTLLVQICRTWPVRVDVGPGSTYVLVYGLPADLDQVESLFVTASTLMSSRAHQHVTSGVWKGTSYRPADGGRPRPVTAAVARNAFCLGFVSRLSAKLGQNAARARGGHGGADPAGAPRTAERVELAVRARELEVADYHRAVSAARGTWRGTASAAGTAANSRRAGERAADEFGRGSLADRRQAIGS